MARAPLPSLPPSRSTESVLVGQNAQIRSTETTFNRRTHHPSAETSLYHPPPFTMLQTLPNEILNSVFEHFWAEGTYQRDYNTLRALCLVSKDLLPLARAVLYSEAGMFYRLTPTTRGGEPQAVQDDYRLLLRTLRACPEAAACVRKLDVTIEFQVELSDNNSSILEPIEAACELLTLCRDARTLTLDTPDVAIAAFASRGLGGQLEEASLQCCSRATVDFLAGAPRLRRLHLTSPRTSAEQHLTPLPFDLAWLSVEGPLSSSILSSLLTSSSNSLRHLSLNVVGFKPEHPLPSLPELHSLEIDLGIASPFECTIVQELFKSATSIHKLTIINYSRTFPLDFLLSLPSHLPSLDLSRLSRSLPAQTIVEYISTHRGLQELDLGWREMEKGDVEMVEGVCEKEGVCLTLGMRGPIQFFTHEDRE
ncbi:hypothetical protein BCR35DRAFT_314181 [Leucosporidium creatinivorum]|uniref:F-box domain-containing protein n=1 Tax=Leucosporidium creatinivorum TaxID=106004 RepID=A0A1Y2F3E7_9BASI|nr:hypothetical protein BCR35DRAFT_314181 [Leucosporidium creatinivorum]